MEADRDRAGTREDRQCWRHEQDNVRLRLELAEARREVEALRGELAARAGPDRGVGAAHVGGDAEPQRAAAAASSSRRAGSGGAHVDQHSSPQDRLALYRTLFAGRPDVYARRWENRTTGTSGWWPVHAGSRHTPRAQRQYVPLTDEVVAAHLEGRDTVGLYPLLADDTCHLLVCDFDKATWRLDVQAYVEAAEAAGVPTAVEVSRSGNGAHVRRRTGTTAPTGCAERVVAGSSTAARGVRRPACSS